MFLAAKGSLASAWLLAAFAVGWLAVLPPAAAEEAPDEFAGTVAPLLAQHCVACHGAEKQESGLRLDTIAGLRQGGASGPLWVVGKPAESLLVRVLRGADSLQRMPADAPPLTDEQIAAVERWIAAGAHAADSPADEGKSSATSIAERSKAHWAFQPLGELAPPSIRRPHWVRNPIDAFILARLEGAGLKPSPEADRATLCRRLWLDLVGLPPEPEEVDAFLDDNRPDAYERLVERLLASPHYGERWGRHWLDLARYADSNGYTIDGARSIWKYRDWVIAALNADMPFDRFTVEQLAGDLLPGATIDQRIATGFHRNTLKNEEGGTDPEQFRVEAVADRVSTTGLVWLGLTVGCARCHDHKYDPISQREFYSLFAVLNNCDEPTLEVPTAAQQKELPALEAEIAQVKKRLADVEANAGTRQAAWEAELRPKLAVDWKALEDVQVESNQATRFERNDDGSFTVVGDAPAHDVYAVYGTIAREGSAALGTVTGLRLEAFCDDRLPERGPGLAKNGNFVLTEVVLATAPVSGSATPSGATDSAIAFATAMADHSQDDHPATAAIDGNSETGWAIGTTVTQGSPHVDRTAWFVLGQPLETVPGGRLRIELRHESPKNKRYQIGRFRLSVTSADARVLSLPFDVRAALAVEPSERQPHQHAKVREEYLKIDPERVPVAKALADLEQRKKQLEASITTTLVVAERAMPRETHVHIRGDFLRPGELVSPGVPAVLPPLSLTDFKPASRLDFAHWLVDGRNPLPPRVTVNRVWQQFFGRGLVETENDFGLQGSPPSHPELLDWLARAWIECGWSMKSLHRLIVGSATYRQASHGRDDLAAVDPTNRLLGRQNRLRLEAEIIRDAALSVSGLLTRDVGGPGVYPPQPAGIYRFTQQVKYWPDTVGPDRYRRTMYTFFWRSSPYPFLTTFDAPDANVACTRRPRSNTPLQALTMANDHVFVECAQHLGIRAMKTSPAERRARLERIFRLALARVPQPRELAVLEALLEHEVARMSAQPQAVAAIVPNEAGTEIDRPETAAWVAVARALLNVDEFVTRE